MRVAGRLAVLLLTVVLAPAFAYVVFTTLRAPTFAPGATLAGLRDFLEAFLLRGDLGFSGYYSQPVTDVLLDGMPADVAMLLGGLAFGLVVGGGAGLLAVHRPHGVVARLADFIAGLGLSLPVYWLGLMVLLLFGSNTGMIAQLPFVSGAGEYEKLPNDPVQFAQTLWVPCVAVGAPLAAGAYRMTVSALRDALVEDYVRTARAKGLHSRAVLARHALPVAGIPVIVLVASQVNLLVANIALLQSAFNIPGSFREIRNVVDNGDTDMLQGLIAEGALFIALANTAADLVQTRVDPRVHA